MSSYYAKVRSKKTGEVRFVFCIDDYFRQHDYGYDLGDKIITQDQLDKEYEFVNSKEGEPA